MSQLVAYAPDPGQEVRPVRGARVRRWQQWLLAAATAYLGVVALVAVFQRKLIYHPTQLTAVQAQQASRSVGCEEWRDGSGRLLGWKRPSRLAKPWGQVLVLHGNAGWAIRRHDFTGALQSIAALDVYLLEYPGYGPRPGKPTQDTLYRATTEALQSMPASLPSYVIGESLGTGPACYLAGTQPALVNGVLLIAPYTQLADVAQRHYPWLPVRWLLRDSFPSTAYLRGYRGPVGVWLAGQDTVVPAELGKKLYSGYAGPKQLWEYPEAAHNNLAQRRQTDWEQVIEFWLRHRPVAPRR